MHKSHIAVWKTQVRRVPERRSTRFSVPMALQLDVSKVRRLCVVVFGAMLSFWLHALLISWGLMGVFTPHTKHPENQGVGASATDSNGVPVMTMILIDDPRHAAERRASSEVPSRGFTARDLEVRVISPNPYPVVDVSRASESGQIESPEVPDVAERAAAFEGYMSQVNARIRRAWVRPQVSTTSRLFECDVTITQDRLGYVKDVKVLDCDGDTLWQQSLKDAIRSASPLPAPPDPEVFSETLSTKFEW